MSDKNDPWRSISSPSQSTRFSGLRVDPDLPWNVFWGLDLDGRCLLVLTHAKENRPEQKLPRLRGLEVELGVQIEDGSYPLVLRLLDGGQRELFHRLCLDIISATERAGSEKAAVELFLKRTWSWHRLLQAGRSGALSEEEQKGLIGELWVLQRVLFPVIGVRPAIRAWRGPLDSPKDFEVGDLCIESKSHRGTATPFVEISSEYQLDTEGTKALFLHVLEIALALAESQNSVTLTETVSSIVDEVASRDPAHLVLLEERLLAAGFESQHDYSDTKWQIGSAHTFEVRDNFPRLTFKEIRGGVHRVRYRIALSDCEPYRVPLKDLKRRLREGT